VEDILKTSPDPRCRIRCQTILIISFIELEAESPLEKLITELDTLELWTIKAGEDPVALSGRCTRTSGTEARHRRDRSSLGSSPNTLGP
jgi:hypothetical protein